MKATIHLAQLNIGRLIAPTDDPRVAEFMGALDRVNGLGKRMPGFVWTYLKEARLWRGRVCNRMAAE